MCQIRIQDEVNMYWLIIAPLKGWTSSNMWEQPKQMKILYRKKSGGSGNQWMIFSLCKFKIKIYWILILPLVLYGCETWSLTMREERSLRVCKNSMLIIFETMLEEVIREWIKLHNEDHNDLNSPPNMIGVIKFQRINLAGHIASICEEKGLQAFGG